MLDELQEHVESIDMANGKGILHLESGSSSSSFSDVLFGAIWTFCLQIFISWLLEFVVLECHSLSQVQLNPRK